MASIVLSFVGEQDPYSEKTEEEGSIVTLLRYLISEGHQIQLAILLHTEGTAKKAEDTRDHVATEAQLLSIDVELVSVSEELSKDPTDLLKAAQEARRGLSQIQANMKSDDFVEFNASSGTPAMKSAFSVLQAAGYVSNSRVWQVRNPHQMREGQSRVFETDVGVLRREFDLRSLKSQVEGFNYSAALITITNSGLSLRLQDLRNLISAGEAWQRGEFRMFYQLVISQLPDGQKNQGSAWWWMGYEQAYTAMIRLQQGNTSEAMQHSFRAIEGLLWEWAIATFPDDLVIRENEYPLLKDSILTRYPTLRSRYEEQLQRGSDVRLQGYLLRDLLEVAIPATSVSNDFLQYWNTARKARNFVSHRLGGISEMQVLKSWGSDVCSRSDLEKRLLACLNLLTGKSFRALVEASLFAKVHQKVMAAIASYQP